MSFILSFSFPAKLAEGVPVGGILDEVHEHTQPHCLQRIDLIQRKDLHNIRRDFKLNVDTNLLTPEMSFEEINPTVECGSSQCSDESMDLTDDEDDCTIKSMLKSMLVMSKQSVLDKYNKEILRIILKQGMDILTDKVPKSDESTVTGQVVGSQNIIPQKRRPLTRTDCAIKNSDSTELSCGNRTFNC